MNINNLYVHKSFTHYTHIVMRRTHTYSNCNNIFYHIHRCIYWIADTRTREAASDVSRTRNKHRSLCLFTTVCQSCWRILQLEPMKIKRITLTSSRKAITANTATVCTSKVMLQCCEIREADVKPAISSLQL